MIKEKDISNNEKTMLKKPIEMILKTGHKTALSPSWARRGVVQSLMMIISLDVALLLY